MDDIYISHVPIGTFKSNNTIDISVWSINNKNHNNKQFKLGNEAR